MPLPELPSFKYKHHGRLIHRRKQVDALPRLAGNERRGEPKTDNASVESRGRRSLHQRSPRGCAPVHKQAWVRRPPHPDRKLGIDERRSHRQREPGRAQHLLRHLRRPELGRRRPLPAGPQRRKTVPQFRQIQARHQKLLSRRLKYATSFITGCDNFLSLRSNFTSCQETLAVILSFNTKIWVYFSFSRS